jgi:hypothetical protein
MILASSAAVAALAVSAGAQRVQPPVHVDGWGRPVAEKPKDYTPGPAPKRDLSGIYEPAAGWRAGVQATGARDFPSDRAHTLPFTPLGEKTWRSHRPGFGVTAVEIQYNNDPFNICDPIGTPRISLFNLRGLQIVQTPKQVLLLYQNSQVWRNIWTDGRELPKEFDEPRWYGYSVGKWTDDYTFVATTRGLDERHVDRQRRTSAQRSADRGRDVPSRQRRHRRADAHHRRPEDVHAEMDRAEQVQARSAAGQLRHPRAALLAVRGGQLQHNPG